MEMEAEYFDCFGGCHFDKVCEKICETEAHQKVNQCPGYGNCYDGCPCLYSSPYCEQDGCESLHEDLFADFALFADELPGQKQDRLQVQHQINKQLFITSGKELDGFQNFEMHVHCHIAM